MAKRQQGVLEWVTSADEAGQRLDAFLVQQKLDQVMSRGQWQKLVEDQQVILNGRSTKSSHKLRPFDYIQVLSLPTVVVEEEPIMIAAELPPILYEDEDVLVLDKPAGIIVHPRPGGVEASIAGTVQSIVEDDDKLRPGIVHRLDKDTSGVLLIAKNVAAKTQLQAAFKARAVEKRYLAVVDGHLGKGIQRLGFGLSRGAKPNTMAVDPLGKQSETFVQQLSAGERVSLVEARPTTGRTHQIRVHLATLKHPVVGDRLYGNTHQAHKYRLMLHAWQLTVPLPSGERKTFISPLPKDYLLTMERLECPLPSL